MSLRRSALHPLKALQSALTRKYYAEAGIPETTTVGQLDPQITTDAQQQVQSQVQPLLDAVKAGNKNQGALALSQIAQQHHDLFEAPSADGMLGEVKMGGVPKLLTPDERAGYAQTIREDQKLDVLSKARIMNALNLSGEVKTA